MVTYANLLPKRAYIQGEVMDMLLRIIKRTRLEHNKTEQQAGDWLNISKRTYQRLERGERKRIPIAWMCRLAELYHISAEVFLRDAIEEIEREKL